MAKLSTTSQIMYSPDQSAEHVEEEVYHLVAENRILKKSLTEVNSIQPAAEMYFSINSAF